MTVLARRIRATPFRSANETWDLIVGLLAPKASGARDELVRVAGVASSLIASEACVGSPIVVWGSGPRVRLYCLFGDDAITGDDANEQAFSSAPAAGDWSMSLPCPAEDLEWVKAALAKQSSRATARKVGDAVPADVEETESEGAATSASIDKGAFFRP